MQEPIVDTEWSDLVGRARDLIPHDEEVNKSILEDFYGPDRINPRGCTLTNGSDRERAWVCKMYLGGKQRVLGYGSAFQMATLYDAALWRFTKYRTGKFLGSRYNFSEGGAADSNMHADINSLVCSMEELLLQRGVLRTAEQRAADRSEQKNQYQHNRYTAKGRIETQLESLFEAIENMTLGLEQILARLDKLERIQPVVRFVDNPSIPPFNQPNPAWTTPTCKIDSSVCNSDNPVQQ